MNSPNFSYLDKKNNQSFIPSLQKKLDYPDNTPATEHRRVVITQRPVKHQPNFSFTQRWEAFPENLMNTLMHYLGIKDLLSLFTTCKTLQKVCRDPSLWKWLIVRDFNRWECSNLSNLNLRKGYRSYTRANELTALNLDHIDPKAYYQFLLFTEKIGVKCHTGSFLKESSLETQSLMKTLEDFTPISNRKISTFISGLGRTRGWLDDIKLSWTKHDDKVYLWTADVKMSHKKEGTRMILSERPASNVISIYSFPDKEKIKDVYFLNDQFFVIEVEGLDQNHPSVSQGEVHGSNQRTIFIYNVEDALEMSLTASDLEPCIAYSFSPEIIYSVKEEGSHLENDLKGKRSQIEHKPMLEYNYCLIQSSFSLKSTQRPLV